MSKPIALILGSGPRVGAAVSQRFAKDGYQVAIVARKGTDARTSEGILSLQANLAESNAIPKIFEKVKQEFGSAPSVVVYNAATLTPPPADGTVFSISGEAVANDLTVNTVNAYVAAQEAFKGWESLSGGAKKVFIYTGNILNTTIIPVPMFFTLGMGKAASAQWIGTADTLLSAKGFRFIYADERLEDGKLVGMDIDGPAHAEFYAALAKDNENVPWHATFVKGKGYTKF